MSSNDQTCDSRQSTRNFPDGEEMDAYQRYLKQKALASARLFTERQSIRDAVLAEIQECVQEFGFECTEIFKDIDATNKQPKKRRVKYMNPETGQTWTGAGREPKWIKGKDRDQFLIKSGAHPIKNPESN